MSPRGGQQWWEWLHYGEGKCPGRPEHNPPRQGDCMDCWNRLVGEVSQEAQTRHCLGCGEPELASVEWLANALHRAADRAADYSHERSTRLADLRGTVDFVRRELSGYCRTCWEAAPDAP